MINIQSNSRKIKQGDTFIAVKCEVNDGHKYVEDAIKNGAAKVVVEKGDYSVQTIKVPDTREYLKKYLVDNYNKYLEEMTIIGITGTNGKTTTAYLMYQALNKLGVKAAYIGTIGFYLDKKIMSLPNTSVDICDEYDLIIQAYDAGFKTVIMEVSSHALYNGRLDTIRFDYTLFTNLTQDHLDYHKTMEKYALAKQLLFKMLKPNGKAIVNIDDNYKDYFLLNQNENITFGFNDSDFKINDIKMSNKGTYFDYTYNNKKCKLHTKLIGRYNIYNVMGVVILLSLMNFSNIEKVIGELEPPEGRMDTIDYGTNSIIIDYAHTPDGLNNFISTVKEFTKGNIYIVFGCTGDRDRLKRPIMTDIVGSNSKYFIITNDDPHYEDPNQIVEDMTKEYKDNNYEVCLDRKEAIIKGINMLKENDLLLILGKGHEEVMIIKDKRVPFNDKKTVMEYIGGI